MLFKARLADWGPKDLEKSRRRLLQAWRVPRARLRGLRGGETVPVGEAATAGGATCFPRRVSKIGSVGEGMVNLDPTSLRMTASQKMNADFRSCLCIHTEVMMVPYPMMMQTSEAELTFGPLQS